MEILLFDSLSLRLFSCTSTILLMWDFPNLEKNNIIYPIYSNVTDTTLCTTISNEFGIKVSTIEHLMGAFYGVGIDNAIVEIDAQEIPILDGSAKLFVDKIKNVGLAFSDTPIKIIKINKKIKIEENNKYITIKIDDIF